jgi:hypothetical protein
MSTPSYYYNNKTTIKFEMLEERAQGLDATIENLNLGVCKYSNEQQKHILQR